MNEDSIFYFCRARNMKDPHATAYSYLNRKYYTDVNVCGKETKQLVKIKLILAGSLVYMCKKYTYVIYVLSW